jgi:uncharacterized protein YneF (UPF0154 family)
MIYALLFIIGVIFGGVFSFYLIKKMMIHRLFTEKTIKNMVLPLGITPSKPQLNRILSGIRGTIKQEFKILSILRGLKRGRIRKNGNQ